MEKVQLPEELNKEAAPLEDLLGARLSLCGGPARERTSTEEDGGEGRRRRRMGHGAAEAPVVLCSLGGGAGRGKRPVRGMRACVAGGYFFMRVGRISG